MIVSIVDSVQCDEKSEMLENVKVSQARDGQMHYQHRDVNFDNKDYTLTYSTLSRTRSPSLPLEHF